MSARDAWLENLFRPLVVGVMVGCIAWSLGQLAREFAPKWNPSYLVVGCVLAALEAFLSYRVLQTERMRGLNVLRFRMVELLIIFIFLKLGGYAGRSLGDVLAQIRAWPNDLSQLFDLETMAAFALALSCWAAATETVKDLERIGEPPASYHEPISPVERLTNRFFAGGAVLLIVTGLASFGSTSELLDLRRSSVGGLAFNVLVYFLLGLVMLGQAQFLRLRTQWQKQLVEIADELPSRWVRYSLALVGLAALWAFLLPTGFTLNPLQAATYALGVIGVLLTFLATLLVTIVTLPFSLLFWLLSRLLSGTDQGPPPALGLPAFEAPSTSEGGAPESWLAIVRTLVFWAVLLAGVYFLVRSYLRDRPELREALGRFRPIQTLRWGWATLWRWLKGWGARFWSAASERMPHRLPRRPPPVGSSKFPLRFFRLRALSPRERVQYYYLSILRRASKQGFPRQSHQTPHEHYANLKPNLPQAQDDMGVLTQAFVEARYSLHTVEPDQDRRVRASWERVKAALRSLKRRDGAEE
jgi:hypothetical protein